MEVLVSIITPMFNSEEYIEETIESVLKQSYKNWEMIIIDDCSTDRSFELVKKYIDKDIRVKYLKNYENKGPAVSRNIGIDKSKGKYIAFLDSDDFWDIDKLKYQVIFMEKENFLITHTDYYFTNIKGKKIKKIITSDKINYKKLLKGNQFKTMCMMINKELIKELRIPQIKHEDYAFFLDLLRENIESIKVPKSLGMCRLRKNSVSSDKIKSALWTWRIYRDYENFNLIKTIYYFINYVLKGLLKYK